MGLLKSKKKYSCVFCSNLDKISSSNKIVFCGDCKKIRNYIRVNGLYSILNIINTNVLPKPKPTVPPYEM